MEAELQVYHIRGTLSQDGQHGIYRVGPYVIEPQVGDSWEDKCGE